MLCFKNKDLVLLESWPSFNSKFINNKIEGAVDKSREIISLVNAGRMKAKLKRRWPVNRVVICTQDKAFLESHELSELLKKQLNTIYIDIKIINFSNFFEKVNSLFKENLVTVNAKPRINKIAPQLKNDLKKALQAFGKIDYADLFAQLMSERNFILKFSSGEIELSKDDVEFSYDGKTPYIMVE